jgi:hypothetical protein
MSATATATASATMITVAVKTMMGNLIPLQVNPAEGLKGVEYALSLFDSNTYDLFHFRVFFMDEDVSELTNDIMLGVVLCPRYLLSEIKTFAIPGVNDSFHRLYTLFTFQHTDASSHNTSFHVCVKENRPGKYTSVVHEPTVKEEDALSRAWTLNELITAYNANVLGMKKYRTNTFVGSTARAFRIVKEHLEKQTSQ